MAFLAFRSWICVAWEMGTDSHQEAMDRCLNFSKSTTLLIAKDDGARLIEAETGQITSG